MATPTPLSGSFAIGSVLTASQMNDIRGAFRVLQVVSGTTTTVANNSNAAVYTDSTLTVTITPQSVTSKIFVAVNQTYYLDTSVTGLSVRLVRSSTTIQTQTDPIYSAGGALVADVSFLYLDTPATTSATTYKTTFARRGASGTATANINNNPANITVFEISA